MSFKTLKQISRRRTSTSVEPPWNSTNNSVVRFFSFFNNRYYYSIRAKTGFRTTYGSAYRRKRTGPCTYNYMQCLRSFPLSLSSVFFLSSFFSFFPSFSFFLPLFFLSTLHSPTPFGWGPTPKQVVRPNHLNHPLDAPGSPCPHE